MHNFKTGTSKVFLHFLKLKADSNIISEVKFLKKIPGMLNIYDVIILLLYLKSKNDMQCKRKNLKSEAGKSTKTSRRHFLE